MTRTAIVTGGLSGLGAATAERLRWLARAANAMSDAMLGSDGDVQASALLKAAELYGHDHVSDAPRRYDRKVKNAQEAHEAIRRARRGSPAAFPATSPASPRISPVFASVMTFTKPSESPDATALRSMKTPSVQLKPSHQPWARVQAATSRTVVVLPFDPVTASTFGLTGDG